MRLICTAAVLMLSTVAPIGFAQTAPGDSTQRSGYGGADQGSVGTTDSAGRTTRQTMHALPKNSRTQTGAIPQYGPTQQNAMTQRNQIAKSRKARQSGLLRTKSGQSSATSATNGSGYAHRSQNSMPRP